MARGHVHYPALCCGAGLEVDCALDEVVRMTVLRGLGDLAYPLRVLAFRDHRHLQWIRWGNPAWPHAPDAVPPASRADGRRGSFPAPRPSGRASEHFRGINHNRCRSRRRSRGQERSLGSLCWDWPWVFAWALNSFRRHVQQAAGDGALREIPSFHYSDAPRE